MRLPPFARTALLIAATLAGPSAFGAESRTPADFDVPVSAHIECDSATDVEVKGLGVKTIDDVLKLRERLAAKEFSREDLQSWRALDAIGVERVVREQDALAVRHDATSSDDAMISRFERLTGWRSDVIDFDAGRYARRSSRGDRNWLRLVVPTSKLWVDFGYRDEPTEVRHAAVASGEGIRRIDAAEEGRNEAGGILGTAPRGPGGDWEIVRTDASGTLFRKTFVPERSDPRLKRVSETYLLADADSEEVRCIALFIDGRPYYFWLSGQRLPQEDSDGRVVPQVTLEFRQRQWNWTVDARFLRRVDFNPELSPETFSYRLKAGDRYLVKLENGIQAQIASEAGLDVAAMTPDEAWSALSGGTKSP